MAMDHDSSASSLTSNFFHATTITFFPIQCTLLQFFCLHTLFSFFTVSALQFRLRNISSVQMGVCDWIKRISGTKRKKENAHKKSEHIQQVSIDSNGSKDGYSTRNKSSFVTSSREVIGRSMGTKEFAATRIQTAFRAYKARKTLRYLKGISRFQALIEADALKKQTSTALERLHFWSKFQAEISARRHCMVTEGPIKQMKLENQLKVESKLHELEMEWSDGQETVEKTVSKIQQREEAANRRERALAYAFSHQWRANSNRYFGQAYHDLSNESWGWNWIERWIAVCRWEGHVVVRPVVSPRARLQNKPKETTKMVAAKPQMENGKGTTKASNCTF